jgi:septal ring factor EnvC (AmiA/AmiB activator)
LLIGVLAVGAVLIAGTSAGAKNAASLRSQADQLRAQNATLDAASHRALLELYALDAKLARSRQRLDQLQVQQIAMAKQQHTDELALGLARSSEQKAQKALFDRARALYIEGDPDPLAVILNASSLDDLISTIDGVNRLAQQDEMIITQLRRSQQSLQEAMTALEKRQAALAKLTEQAQQAAASLASARTEKLQYLTSLSRRKAFNARQIASLASAASQAEQKAQSFASGPSASSGQQAGSALRTKPGRVRRQVAPTSRLPRDGRSPSPRRCTACEARQLRVSRSARA